MTTMPESSSSWRSIEPSLGVSRVDGRSLRFVISNSLVPSSRSTPLSISVSTRGSPGLVKIFGIDWNENGSGAIRCRMAPFNRL